MQTTMQDSEFLSDLVLLRNDENLLKNILPIAKQGNANAQYAIGLIYAEGRGVKPDKVLACYWLTRAIRQGDKDARLLRDIVMNEMTENELYEVDKMGVEI